MKATAIPQRTARFALAIVATMCLVSQAFNARFVPTTKRILLKQQTLRMHMGHSHSHHTHDHAHNHDHGHEHDHHEDDEVSFFSTTRSDQPLPLSSWGRFLNPGQWFRHKREKVFLAALMVVIPAMIRRRFTKLDLGAFVGIATVLSVFDTLKFATKKWISKVQVLQQSVLKHSTPLTRSYFFKNDNAADRITLLGVYINIFLSVIKFFGGIIFNSAVLVADAGHSLSDLFSDFITLWAVQIARLPPDEDHPYGHGKFESVGSLFLSLTLLATGLSVGTWSYEKMREVITMQQLTVLTAKGVVSVANNMATTAMKLPAWPALVLAALSIASKEWLFQVTKRVGEALNSQILVANAWHHRSDAFSSILSLLSIAVAITIPGFLVADSAAGILVAGMICITGMEILFESVKQLTDTSDSFATKKVAVIAKAVPGVLGVANIRARTVGSGSLVDLTVLTDVKISSSAAHAIGEKTRWKILEGLPYVSDVLVRTRSTETVCPLLSKNQRDPAAVEQDIRQVLSLHKEIKEVKRVTVHYVNTAVLCTEILIRVDSNALASMSSSIGGLKNAPQCTVEDMQKLAKKWQQSIKSEILDVMQAEIYLDLTGGNGTDATETSGLDILQGGKISSISSLSLVDNDHSKSKTNSLQKKRYTLDAWRTAATAQA